MKKQTLLVMSVMALGFMVSGCTYQRTATSKSTHLDGTKVDYSQMDKYITAKTCYNRAKTNDASLSILESSKKAGITTVVYVDETITGDLICVIIYGE